MAGELNQLLKNLNYNLFEPDPTKESASHILLTSYYIQPKFIKIINNHHNTTTGAHNQLTTEVYNGLYGPLNKPLFTKTFYLKPSKEAIEAINFFFPQVNTASKVEYEETETETKTKKTKTKTKNATYTKF